MECPYSRTEIVIAHLDPSLPMECPICNAIRKIPTRHIWSDMVIYPSHKQPDGFLPRRRYKYVDGVWKIVD